MARLIRATWRLDVATYLQRRFDLDVIEQMLRDHIATSGLEPDMGTFTYRTEDILDENGVRIFVDFTGEARTR